MKLIEDLQWRYATKKYDASKKASEDDIAKIKGAIQLSASSYGLQPYKIIDIRDEKLRADLKPLSWDQPQITDASHLFLFCNKLEVTAEDVDAFIDLTASERGQNPEDLKGYADFMKNTLAGFPKDVMQSWTARQTYIALGNGLSAAAELKVDSTPMEGFDNEAYNEKLGLNEKGYNALVLMAIGYRSEDDDLQHAAKVRKPVEVLFEEV
jgi:nitroreductase